MHIQRSMEKELRSYATMFTVVAVLGPRQSGKTTLVQATFPHYKYVSFEDVFEERSLAEIDPKGFLEKHRNEHGIILDEFQHVPHILSYIQLMVDAEKKPGYFILTGSQNFLLNEKISQTLAGRVALLTLLPLTVDELQAAGYLPETPEKLLFTGSYPSLYGHAIGAEQWYPPYIRTYLERDVRQIRNITNLSLFQTFIQLCAGRIGQTLNINALSNDSGVDVRTINAWLSLLQASYIIFLVQPYYKNFSKRITKSPKLYFYDTGLACSLLGIDSVEQLASHYLRGSLFESFALAELNKHFYNAVKEPRIYFWRDQAGHEVDCIVEKGTKRIPIEIKASKTMNQNFFDGLVKWASIADIDKDAGYVIYAGDTYFKGSHGTILGWKEIRKVME